MIVDFSYIKYLLDDKGEIIPVLFYKYHCNQKWIEKFIKTSWEIIEPLNLTELCQFEITESNEIFPAFNQKGNPINLVSKCPFCKQPIQNKNWRKFCLNSDCPQKTGDYKQFIQDRKSFKPSDKDATLDKLRYCAIDTNVLIVRDSQSKNRPLILYRSVDEIFTIFRRLGQTI